MPLVGDSEGGMFGFFFADALPQNYGVVMATDKERFNRFFHAMLDRGVYLAPALYEAGFVSAAHSAEDIAATVQAASRGAARLNPASVHGCVVQSLDGGRRNEHAMRGETAVRRDRREPTVAVAGGAALTAGMLMAPRISRGATRRARAPHRLAQRHWCAGVRSTLSEALRELGWIEGRNLAVEVRHAEGQREQAPALAKELVGVHVELIVAEAPTAIRAAMQATTEVPIVMAWWGGPDLVTSGVIASYGRPGGNVTGVDMLLSALDAKRLDVLRQAVPNATKIAVLIHDRQAFEPQMPAVREVARKAGLSLEIFDTPRRQPHTRASSPWRENGMNTRRSAERHCATGLGRRPQHQLRSPPHRGPARTVACIGEGTRCGQGRDHRRRGADADPRGHAGHE